MKNRHPKLFYVEYDNGYKKDAHLLIRTFTKPGAINIIREYYNVPPKNFRIVRQATMEDVNKIDDKRIMVCGHMMIPWEHSYHGELAKAE